jgi:hypothetical protein
MRHARGLASEVQRMNYSWPTWSDSPGGLAGPEHYNLEDAEIYFRNLLLRKRVGQDPSRPVSRVGEQTVDTLLRDAT